MIELITQNDLSTQEITKEISDLWLVYLHFFL